MRDSKAFARVDGFDGAPGIGKLTSGLVKHADLTKDLSLGCADVVLCLEVAEHIPATFESTLLSNLNRHNAERAVSSSRGRSTRCAAVWVTSTAAGRQATSSSD